MAKTNHIAEALFAIEDEVANLRALLDTFFELNPDHPSSLLRTVDVRVRPVEARLEALGALLRREVLPIVADMSLNGGMGAMAPMVAKATARQFTPSRA